VSQTTGNLALIDTTTNPNISNITINPFSDYAVHNMRTGLADGVSQGKCTGAAGLARKLSDRPTITFTIV
jgi:CxxC motif-containing protein (DUF1111 family)